MRKGQQLQIGTSVRVGNVLTIVRAKLEDAAGLVPAEYLLVEIAGARRFKIIEGIGLFEIDQGEADEILARVEVRAWRDAGLAIARARVRARITCPGSRPTR